MSTFTLGCGSGPGDSDAGGDPGSDTGTDAHFDANSDAAPACRMDVDCNDGLFCNGDERCVSGACVAGMAPACGDAIECTRDFCSEDRRMCQHQVPDVDLDGHGDAACVDGAGIALGDDCADTDANRFPGNTEVCDAMMHDEDCVMTTHGAIDHDSDGFEDATCCNGTDCGDDCDDSNRSVSPAGIEVCDHLDNNCDTHVDEMLGVLMYPDADRDGYGDSTRARDTQCGDTVGYAVLGGDCSDTRVDRNPGQLEVCDMIDNDCDMAVDENAGNVPWYVDADHDGYGDPDGATLVQCAPPAGDYSLAPTDCDDTTNTRSPRAPEVCNAIDDDCNGLPDFQIGRSDLEDDDRDHVADVGCGGALGRDCNDRDATTYPGAAEICNGRNDDCDASVDEDATSATFHRDADMDGYGDPGTAVIACFAPGGYVLDGADCDDSAMGRHPGAAETCNASDDDCDRRIDETPAESSCSIPGAIAACTVGICHVAGCSLGFSDCTIADGCETSTIADDTRCGSCTNVCDPMSSQCAQARCVPGGFDGVAGVSPGSDVGTAVSFDGTNVAMGGSFSGPGFGVGCATHYDAQGKAGVVSLRDAQGRCLQSIAIDGTGDEIVTSVLLGSAGSVYVALTTTSTTLSVGGMAANAAAGQGMRDVVIARLAGTPLAATWVRRIGGLSDDTITDLAGDQVDLWAVGAMRGPVTIGTQTIAASTSTDSVVIHLGAPDGAVMHVASATSTGDDGARALALDATTVYVVGSVTGAATFGTTSVTPMGTDGYLWLLSRIDASSTNVRTFGGAGTDVATGVGLNPTMLGAPIGVAGNFQGTMTIDSYAITSAGMSDGFVVGLDGVTLAAQFEPVPFGGPGDDVINDLAYALQSFSVVGTFSGSAFLGVRDAGVTSTGGTDGFTFAVDVYGFPSDVDLIGGVGAEEALSIATSSSGGAAWIAGDYDTLFHWRTSTFPSLGRLDAFWLRYTLPLG